MKKTSILLSICVMLLSMICFSTVAYADSYTITLTAEPAEGGIVTGQGEYEEGQNAVFTATPAEGYTFLGWFRPEEDTPFSTELQYNFDLEVTRSYIAKFERQLTVGAIAEPAIGGTVSQSGDGTYALGEQVTLTAIANEGYEFLGWLDASSPVEPVHTESLFTFPMEAPVSYIAKFVARYQLDVNVSPGEGGSVLGAGQYGGGSVVILEAIPAEDYRFTGWVSPADPDTVISSDQKYSFNLDNDLTLTATFDRSYAYILTRVFIAVAVAGGAAFGIFIFYRRTHVIRRRRNMRGGRPPGHHN